MKSYEFELTDEVMGKINALTRRPLTKERVYAFPVILCDNETDRDGERFSVGSIETLAKMFVGKTGIFDHDPRGKNQTARIFDTFVDAPEGMLTSNGEQYTCLVARAYMVKTDANKSLIDEIDAGIKKEVSISCSVARKTCSVCGRDIYKSPCSHIKGKSYNGKKCFVSLEEPTDAYEWSFVAVPAQVNAGVKKTFGKNDENPQTPKNDRLYDEHSRMYNALITKAVSLCSLAGFKDQYVSKMLEGLSVDELIIFEKRMSALITRPQKPQLETAKRDNENYKLKS